MSGISIYKWKVSILKIFDWAAGRFFLEERLSDLFHQSSEKFKLGAII